MTGTIRKVILIRGFGFIDGDNGETYFLHVDKLAPGTTWERLHEDQRVEFEETRMENGKGNGLRAVGVRCI